MMAETHGLNIEVDGNTATIEAGKGTSLEVDKRGLERLLNAEGTFATSAGRAHTVEEEVDGGSNSIFVKRKDCTVFRAQKDDLEAALEEMQENMTVDVTAAAREDVKDRLERHYAVEKVWEGEKTGDVAVRLNGKADGFPGDMGTILSAHGWYAVGHVDGAFRVRPIPENPRL